MEISNDKVVFKTPTNNIVVSIDSNQIFIQEITRECYETHDNLTKSEIEWAIKYTSIELLKDPEINGRWPLLVLFILHSCKNLTTGKLSLIYNFELDDAIKQRDSRRLSKLLNLDPFDRWQEKTRNTELTDKEQSELTKIRDKEMIIIINVVAEGRNMRAPYIQKFLISSPSCLINNNDNTTVYSSCYKGVCIQEMNQKRNEKIITKCKGDVCERIDENEFFNNLVSDDLNPEIIMINVSSPTNFVEKELRCYKYDSIIESLTYDEVMDPITKEKLSNDIVDMLKNKYKVDIKIYKFYLNYLNLR